MGSFGRRSLFGLVATLLLGRPLQAQSLPGPIMPAGQRLADTLDNLDVEHLWQAKFHIDWRTGIAHGAPETSPGGHTHCSAFAAAAADRLGIYLLRPPDHGQMWLANAQERWLNGAKDGPLSAEQAGWHSLGRLADSGTAVRAVSLANQGKLVIAIYFQPPRMTPEGPKTLAGHIAIVRPSTKTPAQIEADGPAVMQAGEHNYTDAPMRVGFAAHKDGWRSGAIEFFWHDTNF